MPQIAVINESTDITDAEVQGYLAAFNQQWNQDLLPVWGVDAATFAFVSPNQTPAAGTWWVVFLDDSDQAGALAYHDLTDEGLPISKVYVKTIKADNASVSVGGTHEICEMAVDPWLNSAYQDPQGVFWAGEICDPVEDDQYGYQIGGVLVTDFITPNWFGHRGALAHGAHEGSSCASWLSVPATGPPRRGLCDPQCRLSEHATSAKARGVKLGGRAEKLSIATLLS